jgi:integrase
VHLGCLRRATTPLWLNPSRVPPPVSTATQPTVLSTAPESPQRLHSPMCRHRRRPCPWCTRSRAAPHATELANSEVSVYTLMKLLGHESMVTSQRYVTAAGTETRTAAAQNKLYGLLADDRSAD